MSTVKQVSYRHGLRGCWPGKKPLFQIQHLYAGIKFVAYHLHGQRKKITGGIIYGQIKQRQNCLTSGIEELPQPLLRSPQTEFPSSLGGDIWGHRVPALPRFQSPYFYLIAPVLSSVPVYLFYQQFAKHHHNFHSVPSCLVCLFCLSVFWFAAHLLMLLPDLRYTCFPLIGLLALLTRFLIVFWICLPGLKNSCIYILSADYFLRRTL